MENYKTQIREEIWSRLKDFARPDSRFHLDYSSFICDFIGSSSATKRLTALQYFQSAKTIFIAPDNCLEELRLSALRAGKRVLITTYAIKRGFWLLDPVAIPRTSYELAATLDGMERLGKPMTLANMTEERMLVDLLVTGTGAINLDGIRFGKGHGFFDLEWAILLTLDVITPHVPTVAIVHDCQILDSTLDSEVFDTACDIIATPTRTIEVPNARKPICGVLWEHLAEGMLDSIPCLQELQDLVVSKKIAQPKL